MPTTPKHRRTAGIEERHARMCASRSGSRCSCTPQFRAELRPAREAAAAQDVRDAGRREGVAGGDAGGAAARGGQRREDRDVDRRRVGVAGRRAGWLHAQPVGRRLQAERDPGVRAGTPPPRPPRPRAVTLTDRPPRRLPRPRDGRHARRTVEPTPRIGSTSWTGSRLSWAVEARLSASVTHSTRCGGERSGWFDRRAGGPRLDRRSDDTAPVGQPR